MKTSERKELLDALKLANDDNVYLLKRNAQLEEDVRNTNKAYDKVLLLLRDEKAGREIVLRAFRLTWRYAKLEKRWLAQQLILTADELDALLQDGE